MMVLHPGIPSRLSVVAVHTSLFPPRAPLPTPRARDPAPTVVQVKRQTHVPTGRHHFGYARLIAVRVHLVECGQQPRVECGRGRP